MMKRLLFIGSTVADVVIRVPSLPHTGDDVHVIRQQASLGGCAFNSFSAARLSGAEAVLFSPVGGGLWGSFVRNELEKQGLSTACPVPDGDNGCCYCLVEADGERTFICDHGAEYLFKPEWFDVLNGETFGGVYLCGLEIEDKTGPVLIDYVTAHRPERLLFAPGPRITRIRPELMGRLLQLHPILHLNESEALQFTCSQSAEQAARIIADITEAPVVITLGKDGAYIYEDGRGETVPTIPARVRDTIGAGDCHAGALLAGLNAGLSLRDAAAHANIMAAAVTEHDGAVMTPAQWNTWLTERNEQA